MLPAQRFWRETVSLLDVMWPRSNQWESALLGIKIPGHSFSKSAIHRINRYRAETKTNSTKTNCVIHWIVIDPVDSAIHFLNNWSHLYNNTSYSAPSSCVRRPFIMLTLVISVNPASNNPAHFAKQSFPAWNLKVSIKNLIQKTIAIVLSRF